MPFRMRRSGIRTARAAVSISSPQQVCRVAKAPSSSFLAALIAPLPRSPLAPLSYTSAATHGRRPNRGSIMTASSIKISPWKRNGPSRAPRAGRWLWKYCSVAVAQAIHSPGAPLKPNESTR